MDEKSAKNLKELLDELKTVEKTDQTDFESTAINYLEIILDESASQDDRKKNAEQLIKDCSGEKRRLDASVKQKLEIAKEIKADVRAIDRIREVDALTRSYYETLNPDCDPSAYSGVFPNDDCQILNGLINDFYKSLGFDFEKARDIFKALEPCYKQLLDEEMDFDHEYYKKLLDDFVNNTNVIGDADYYPPYVQYTLELLTMIAFDPTYIDEERDDIKYMAEDILRDFRTGYNGGERW